MEKSSHHSCPWGTENEENLQVTKFLISKNCSYLKTVQIWKLFISKNCSDLKSEQFKFENCSYLKTVQIW
jgi:hypothetical protein